MGHWELEDELTFLQQTEVQAEVLTFDVFCLGETAKAWQVVLDSDVKSRHTILGEILEVSEDVKVWLPKSQCEGDLKPGGWGEVEVPYWLAEEKCWT